MDEANDNLTGAQQQAGGKAAILVVEDEALIRMVIADQLRDSGYDVVETRTADEAVALMEKGLHVDAVFSDVNLPGTLNGIGLARWMRSQRPQVPVLLTSGAISVQDMPADLRDTELLLKPYDVDEVVRRIAPVLANAAATV